MVMDMDMAMYILVLILIIAEEERMRIRHLAVLGGDIQIHLRGRTRRPFLLEDRIKMNTLLKDRHCVSPPSEYFQAVEPPKHP